MKINYQMKQSVIIVFVNVILLSCNTNKIIKDMNVKDMSIKNAIESIHFLEILKYHVEKENIVLYDDTKTNILEKEYGSYKSHNGSQIAFKKIDFVFDINSYKTPKNGVILYNFVSKKNYKIYYFVDAENKLAIQLKVKKNKKVELIEIGNF